MNANDKLFRCLAVFPILFLCLGAGAGAEAQLRRAPYLQMSTSNSVYVVWRTEGPTEPVVRYGPTPTKLEHEVSGEAITRRVSADVQAAEGIPFLYKESSNRREDGEQNEDDEFVGNPSAPSNTYQYEALITGIEPGVKHYYGVYDGARKLAGADESSFFQTRSAAGAPPSLRIWVAGDTGTGDAMQRRVYEAMLKFVEETSRPIDMFMIAGDMAYENGTDDEFSGAFFGVYGPTLRNTVFWPAFGNTEGHTSDGPTGIGPYFDTYVVPTRGEAGGTPSGTEAYYSFDVGNVHFVSLNSHDADRDPAAAMAQWLRADVEKARVDHAEWMIAFWHHAPYSKGTHNSDRETEMVEMRQHIMPILERGGVDLVLTGHSHIYERSMLMDGAYATPTTAAGVILDDGDGSPQGGGPYRKSAGLNPHEGTVHIVTGHGGTRVGREGTMPVMRKTIVDNGSVILDIDGDTLVGRMIDKDARQRDLFSIVKRGKVEASRRSGFKSSPGGR